MVLDAQTDVTAKGTSLKRAGSQTEFASAVVQDMGARIAQNPVPCGGMDQSAWDDASVT